MSKQTGLTKEQLEDLYLVQHLTMEQIAKPFGVTRACICKAIKRFGIDGRTAERFTAICDNCGAEYSITRGRYNHQRSHYCSEACYYSHKASILPLKRINRHARRIGRAVMEAHLGRPLTSSEVIHHIDGDNHNNSLDNLMLFVSNAEHVRYHHQMRIAKAREADK